MRYLDGPRPKYGSRQEPLLEVVERLGPLWNSDPDPGAQAAAHALEVTHKNLHRLLKPDETAEGAAVANARHADPAANENAQIDRDPPAPPRR